MQAVITVTGKDSVGIIAKVSQKCVEYNVNIVDISQSVLKDYFAMIMVVEIDKLTIPFTDFVDAMNAIGNDNGLSIHTMHEDIFNSMHRI
ncbi:MAG: ACT domain-containing protein [Clostridia bacterium]|nr:ACT domain-containing protein [Clostridia bacterium]